MHTLRTMYPSHLLLVGVVVSVMLVTTQSKAISDPGFIRHRVKRQFADMTLGQHLINLGLSHGPQGCREVACGLVNIAVSGKRKRSYRVDQYSAPLRDKTGQLRTLERLVSMMLDESPDV